MLMELFSKDTNSVCKIAHDLSELANVVGLNQQVFSHGLNFSKFKPTCLLKSLDFLLLNFLTSSEIGIESRLILELVIHTLSHCFEVSLKAIVPVV